MKINKITKCGDLQLPDSSVLHSSRVVDETINVKSFGEQTFNGSDIGVWECEPGYFSRQVMQAEYSYIISGKCIFTCENGEEIFLSAGDTVFFPPNTKGEWHIIETLRKSYLILK